MKRRSFLKKTTAAGLGMSMYPFASKAFLEPTSEIIELTILHTNDVHSHIDPFPMDDPKYPGLGGVARRMQLIESIKKEKKHVLILDSGDIFQGTPYFNLFGGELEFKSMSKMGYEVSTLGNHDFDNGIDGLIAMLPHAKFDFVNCNYQFNNPLNQYVLPYKIIYKGPLKIGVFGIGIELEGLVDAKLCKGIQYEDPVQNAQNIATYLKEVQACDYVICLSHLGYSYAGKKMDDLKLAKQTRNIDLILGGHTHTFLTEPKEVTNKSGQITMVNQVGWAGIQLGFINIFINIETRQNLLHSQNKILHPSQSPHS